MTWFALLLGSWAAAYAFATGVLDALAPEPSSAAEPHALPGNVVVLADARRRLHNRAA